MPRISSLPAPLLDVRGALRSRGGMGGLGRGTRAAYAGPWRSSHACTRFGLG